MRREKYRAYLWNRLLVSVLSITSFFYSDMTRNLLRIFHCLDVDENLGKDPQYAIATSTYWVENTDVECYKRSHLVLVLALGIPLLLLVTIGIPLWLLVTPLWNQERLSEDGFMTTYGFL